MNALALVVVTLALGSQASSSSSSPSPGVANACPSALTPADDARERSEVPRVTATLAVPLSSLRPAHAVFAGQLTAERAGAGALAQLRERGGQVTATLVPDGLVVVAEGAAVDLELVVAAARFARGEEGFTPARSAAQARALVQRGFATSSPQQARAAIAGAAWFGTRSPWRRAAFDDVDLLQVADADLVAARDEVRSAAATLVVEGRLRPTSLEGASAAAACAQTAPTWPPASALAPSPPSVRSSNGPITLSQLLPVDATSDALADAVAAFVEETAGPVGGAHVEIARAAGVRLLVLELTPGADPQAVRAALLSARSSLTRSRDVAAWLVKGRARRARQAAHYGGWASQRAEDRLVRRQPVADDEPPEEPELFTLLRTVLLPERMRLSGPAKSGPAKSGPAKSGPAESDPSRGEPGAQ